MASTLGIGCFSGSGAQPGDAGKAEGGKHDASATSDARDAGPPPPLESSPPAIIPLASRVDATSTPIVYDSVRHLVWTANGDVGTVSYVGVDHGSQKVLQEIAVGTDIRTVALSPDGVWLAAVDRATASVSLIDAATRLVRRTIAVGTHPRSAVWDAADPRWLYVTLEDSGAVAVIDRTLGVLKETVAVGRIPGGLAVSHLRNVLYVTHRIDPMVTTVSLPASPPEAGAAPALSVLNNVMLADQPATTPATVPQGMPFAFDQVAWTADGNTMWVPHELLAPTHPFQFTETLFPAISVVDFSGAGEEVQTDPNDPAGNIAGRKLLFGAIELFDDTANVAIFSQPCAVSMHPNGLTAYALMCASDDLVTFDLTQGIATQMLRNLPGNHPAGIALDASVGDGGSGPSRAFVMSISPTPS